MRKKFHPSEKKGIITANDLRQIREVLKAEKKKQEEEDKAEEKEKEFREKIKNLQADMERFFEEWPGDEEKDPDLLYNACIRICVRRAIDGNRGARWFMSQARLAYNDQKNHG